MNMSIVFDMPCKNWQVWRMLMMKTNGALLMVNDIEDARYAEYDLYSSQVIAIKYDTNVIT